MSSTDPGYVVRAWRQKTIDEYPTFSLPPGLVKVEEPKPVIVAAAPKDYEPGKNVEFKDLVGSYSCACGAPAPLLGYLFSDVKLHLPRPLCNQCREKDLRIKEGVKIAIRLGPELEEDILDHAPKSKGILRRKFPITYRIKELIRGLKGQGRTI